ncbi:MAG: acylphosphatase [Fibrobacter sp.]|jgi:acylphosphatase|nr:acylphosphatase [Fibrobacter sp.]
MESRKRILIIVKGLVQGVYFRYFTREAAMKIGVNGWVRNLSNGDVEIEAQGTEDKLDLFLEQVRKGPQLSRVESTDVTELPLLENENGFVIKY